MRIFYWSVSISQLPTVVFVAFALLIAFVKCFADEGFEYASPVESYSRKRLTVRVRRNDILNWTSPPDSISNVLQNKDFYNKFHAPGQLYETTTDVQVGFYIESMSSFRAYSSDFELDIYLATVWVDKRLTHSHKYPILVNDLRISSLIWQPDLYFSNSKHASLQAVTAPNFMMLVYPDGLVFKSQRIALTLSCVMDFTRYPLDVQSCPIIIQSYAYVQSMLNLSWFVNEKKGFPIGMNSNIRLNDMVILERTYDSCSYWYEMLRGKEIWRLILGYWGCIRGTIKMKRMIFYHLIQTYIPTLMLVCISWLSFWLDPNASPARVGLTITTLLTLSQMCFLSRQGLPQVSYVKAIDVWLFLCIAYVFSVLLQYSCVNFFFQRQNFFCQDHPSANYPAKNGVLAPVIAKACRICVHEDQRFARRLDQASRLMFPLSFGVLAAFYWLFYEFIDTETTVS